MSNLAEQVKTELERIMSEEGVSQNELHRRTGIAQASISQILKGNREIQTDTIERLAEKLGMRATIVFVPIHETAGAA